MQCPKCGYVRKPSDAAPDYECPSCGVVYAKVQTRAPAPAPAPRVEPAEAVRAPVRLALCEDCGGAVSRHAQSCPHCGRPFGNGRALVDVMNVRMEFEAMVWFMVKWALASIPALMILITLFVFVAWAVPSLVGLFR